MRKPDFDNILKVVQGKKPNQDTMFEFAISGEAVYALTGENVKGGDIMGVWKRYIQAFYLAGYDFVPIAGSDFRLKRLEPEHKASIGLADCGIISDWQSFEEYEWVNPDDFSMDRLEELSKFLPEGMKFMGHVAGGGVLENVIRLTGYTNLCYMLADDRELVKTIFDNVGRRINRYYELLVEHDSVGLVFASDDWGFNTSTMISYDDMREFVYPYHKRICEIAHNSGRLAVLHSCGNMFDIFEDIYTEIGYDAKHSYEDNIKPVEEVYKKYHNKLGIMGGMDVDMLCRQSPEFITNRCRKMLELASQTGGYALGSGNSIPSYMPIENYFAMLKCVNPDLKLKG